MRLHSSIPNGILAIRVRTTANEEEQRETALRLAVGQESGIKYQEYFSIG